MQCEVCHIETTENICPECGNQTTDERGLKVYWCSGCRIPVLKYDDEMDINGECPNCFGELEYMAVDVRPVFPEERLLLELLLKQKPYEYMDKSVWANGSRYYIDGEPKMLASSVFRNADADSIRQQLERYKTANSYDFFNENMQMFVQANIERLAYLKDEATRFIKRNAIKFERKYIVASFSGGKDSTVTADLVIKALGDPSIVHIFGDTTLEFPYTLKYAERYKLEHRNAIFKTAKNREQDFYEVSSDIGPPARMMRWCCSMFKTGPITRVINSLYRNKRILTFYGIRRDESVARSKYDRVSKDNEGHVKIQQQKVAAPIFFWKDMDIWLYLLAENIDFNDAYRLGYDRVGCWCCPNNNQRAQFLSRIYMPEQSKKWREFLIGFAKKIGKPDAEEYVDSGKWKARQGGNGLRSAGDVKIRYTNCTSEENAKIYKLVKPLDETLINMLVPFGKAEPGRKLINEIIIRDIRTMMEIISVQPFSQDGYEYAVKIKTINVEDHDGLQQKIAYQIRKFNACRKCLKCESVCQQGAISIVGDRYYINPDRCIHCHKCVDNKYLPAGCMMDKYLKTKNE